MFWVWNVGDVGGKVTGYFVPEKFGPGFGKKHKI
jgi:hypothetical protein